ncbi:MAG: SxtJ family membrane protein [Phycisphaerae bacterium]|jgi:hypothetical protein|nr:SxtJ family membrane protein [Phycisphaerae bacterium]
MIEINKNPSPRTLKQFSLAAAVFAALVGYFAFARTGSWTPAVAIWATGAVVAVVGLARPRCVRWIYLAISYLAAPIGIVVSLIVLAIVYYAVVTPIGVIMGLTGRDPLQRRRDPATGTYWQERKETTPDRYFRQF